MTAAPERIVDIERRFRDSVASAVGLAPGHFDHPGTTIASSPDRAGWRTASAHSIGHHTLLWCDPEVVDLVASLADADVSFPIGDMGAWADSVGARFLGGAWSHLIDAATLRDHLPPPVGGLVHLERESRDDIALIAGLIAAVMPDDSAAAELSLDALDPLMVGLTTPDGSLAAWAGGRPWEHDPAFDNIGVVVRPELRGGGWGRAVVAALCESMFARHDLPLYRCNWDREHSRRLALSIGFRQVGKVAAVRFD